MASLVASLTTSATPSQAATAAGPATNVIVEFSGQPAMRSTDSGLSPAVRASDTRTRRQALRAAHQTFLQQAATAGVHATSRRDFGDLFNGVALRVPQSDVPTLAKLPGVAAVFPDKVLHASVDSDVSLVNAPAAWDTTDPKGTPDTGAGQVIAVIDTGIDYTDPDLGGGFGRGHKVVGGYDLVNNDADPMDDNEHGTHVAGIIAGKAATPDGRTGIAPDAMLTAYKVLDVNGDGDESTIIAGLEMAVDPANPNRAGVVNLSLSGAGSADDPLDAACEAAEQSGTVVVAAAGNNGLGGGPSTVTSPAEAPDVLAVGASVSGVTVPTFSLVSPISRTLHSDRLDTSASPPAKPTNLQVVDVGDGAPADFDNVDVAGKAVLFRYNGDGVGYIAQLAKQHGAAALMTYTPDYYQPVPGSSVQSGFKAGSVDSLGILAVVINGSDAALIQAELAKGPVTVGVTGSDATDEMAGFSSQGPALGSYAVKPDLVAPGVEIRSTVPGGGYEQLSGTSMAAPHVAGAAALVREAHPAWTAAQVQSALTSSAKELPAMNEDLVGAGRLNVLAAVQATVLPSPRAFNLGVADLATSRVGGQHTITLSNAGTTNATVSLTASQPKAEPARVSLSPSHMVIPAGKTATVTLKLSAARPDGVMDIEGDVTAKVTTAGNGSTVSIPYLLAVRPMDLHATPDPTATTSTILIHAEPAMAAPPSVTVTGPTGSTHSTVATLDHTGWWRVVLSGGQPGIYRVNAKGLTTTGAHLIGSTSYQLLPTTKQSNRWESVGPYSQGAPVVMAPSRPGRLYTLPAFAAHAGLFRTDDYGKTWHEERSLPIGDGVSTGLLVDQHDPDTVYMSVEGGNDPSYNSTILVSHDAGETWTKIDVPGVLALGLSTDPSGKLLVVNGGDSVYVSADKGANWQTYPLPDDANGQQVGAEDTTVIGSDLFIGTSNGLYKVPDIVGTPGPLALVYQPDDDNWMAAGLVEHNGEMVARTKYKIVASRDGGKTWATLLDMPPGSVPESVQFVGDDLYVTDDSGVIWIRRAGHTSWSTVSSPTPDVPITQVTRWPGRPGTMLYVATGVGIYQTTDAGAHFTRIGVAGAEITGLAVSHDANGAPLLTAATNHGMYASASPFAATVTSSTRDWGRNGTEIQLSGHIVAMAVAPSDPKTVYRASLSGHVTWTISRSDDGGVTWQTLTNAHITGGAYQIAVNPTDPKNLYISFYDGLGVGLLTSHDGGVHFNIVNEPYPFTAIAVDPTHPDSLWLGGPAGLFHTSDEGQTLTQLQSTAVSSLAIDPRDPQRMIVGGASLSYSLDGGHTLRPSSGDEMRMHVSSVLYAADGTIYAATGAASDAAGLPVNGRGVLRSRDGGRHWENISVGLPDLDVQGLAVSPDGRWIYVGTAGGGVYRAPVG